MGLSLYPHSFPNATWIEDQYLKYQLYHSTIWGVERWALISGRGFWAQSAGPQRLHAPSTRLPDLGGGAGAGSGCAALGGGSAEAVVEVPESAAAWPATCWPRERGRSGPGESQQWCDQRD
jgi:hypothetical protein